MTIPELLAVCESVADCRMIGCKPEHDGNYDPMSCVMLRRSDRLPAENYKRFTKTAHDYFPAALRCMVAIREHCDTGDESLGPGSDLALHGFVGMVRRAIERFEAGEFDPL